MTFRLNFNPKKLLERVTKILKEKSNLLLLILFFISLIGAGFIFYSYIFQIPTPPATGQTIKVNLEVYRRVIDRLNARESNIQQGIGQEYPDVFK